MPQIKIFVINLQRNPARRAYMQSLLTGAKLDYAFIETVDGDAISDADYLVIRQAEGALIRKWPHKKPITAGGRLPPQSSAML